MHFHDGLDQSQLWRPREHQSEAPSSVIPKNYSKLGSSFFDEDCSSLRKPAAECQARQQAEENAAQNLLQDQAQTSG